MTRTLLLTFIITLAGLALLPRSAAQTVPAANSCENGSERAISTIESGEFQKKRYTIHGTWSINTDCEGAYIQFADDFKTKSGPDLKVFLSPKTVAGLNGKSAQNGATNIGVLKSNSGSQTYRLPQGVNVSDYKSVVIQCEAFSVLWGGFDLPSTEP